MIFERIAPEQHDTLDGVPEPSETPRLIGHQQAANMLASAYRAGKLPHALIFAGPVGIGKATLAFHLAHHLLKHPISGEAPLALATPDPTSSLFRQIATGAHPSVLHLTRPANDKTKSFKTVLTVDDGIETPFDGSDDDRCEFRPVEMFGDIFHIVQSSASDTSLIGIVDHKLSVDIQSRMGAGPGANVDLGPCARAGSSFRNMHYSSKMREFSNFTRSRLHDQRANAPLSLHHKDSFFHRFA